MQRSHLIVALATAAVLGLGVWIGALGRGSDEGMDPAEGVPRTAVTHTPPAEVEVPGATLGPDEATALRAQIAKLESRVASLEDELAEAREQTKPLLDLYETFEERGGIPGHEGLSEGDIEILDGQLVTGQGNGARVLAAGLGLGADRQKAFAREAERIVEQIEVLEKAYADVTFEDDTTTIKIGRYAAEGQALAREWDDWIAAKLSPDEQTRYAKSGAKSRLFGNRLGAFDRTIVIRDADGTVTLRESATGDDNDAMTETEMTGPSLARDFVLEGYAHLLK